MSSANVVLYIEANEDGTIGGSHYCLLEIVKRIDREKFLPIVYFYQANTLLSEFKKYCTVIVKDTEKGIVFKKSYPGLFNFFSSSAVSLKVLLVIQKLYNFLFSHLPYYGRVLYLLHKYHVDIVHMNNLPTLFHWFIGAKLTGRICIAHIRGNWRPSKINNFFSKRYDCVISISQSVTDFVSSHGIDTTNIVKIYDGIDTHNLRTSYIRKSAETRKELGLAQDEFVVAVIGNIKNWKGQHVAIEAVRELDVKGLSLKCIIVGDVSLLTSDREYYQHLTQYVKDHKLEEKVIFTGYRRDIPSIVSAVDLLVLTSTDPEPLGRVVFEGMLFERPVIATAHGGPAEIIDDGVTGFLIPPNDAKELSDKIDFVISNPEFATQLGKRARKVVEDKYDISVNVQSIERQYSRYI